jgi:uncharacterized membrane protein YedE/YeeE
LVATEFTPLASVIGGALIGVAAIIYMLFNGRIAGVIGIASDLLPPYRGTTLQSAAFLLGLIAAPLVVAGMTGAAVAQAVSSNLVLLAGAGILVGFGAALGGGCTSGHGVCGLSRLSRRSFIATAVFMATAIVTVFIVRHVIGAPA